MEGNLLFFRYQISPSSTVENHNDVTLNYATASVLSRYVFKKPEIYIGLGLYVGYPMSETTQSSTFINGSLVAPSIPSKANPHAFFREDVGIKSMLGYDLLVNQKRNYTIQFISTLGLINFTKPGNYPLRSNTLTLLFGFSINKA